MFFKQSNYANERVDKIQERLDETQKILWAIKLSVLADSETQKKYHEKFMERLLSFPANEQEIKKVSSSGRKGKKS